MMQFLMAIVEHVQRYVPISLFTIYLTSLSIVVLAGICLFHTFFQRSLYAKHMIWTGIGVRVLMFLAITLEFVHQFSNVPVYAFYGKEQFLAQMINILFYSYILVAGLYHILTIHMYKWRGFFHIFDLVMLSIPVFLILPILTKETVIHSHNDPAIVNIWMLVGLLVLSFFLFYQLYWKQRWTWYVFFFLTAGLGLLLTNQMDELVVKIFIPTFTFILLLAAYEATKLFLQWVKVKTGHIEWKSYRSALALVPVMLISKI